MDLRLAQKRVVVTGSSRGIGFGIARCFYNEGASVAITARDGQGVSVAQKNLAGESSEVRTLGFAGDLTDPGEMERLVATVKNAWGGIDVLVLNLGSGRSQPNLTADATEWGRVLRLNLVAAAEMLRLSTPLLAQGKDPAVVMIGSIAGVEALDAPWAYGAAKAGLAHLVKQAARYLAAQNIRVNMVAPGNIFFEGGAWDKKLGENRKAVESMLKEAVPQERLGTVEEVASAVVFLASPVSQFTTGACLVVDGGQTRH
jgi:3-oxoacyl-[acyl-carrier protein] reductase